MVLPRYLVLESNQFKGVGSIEIVGRQGVGVAKGGASYPLNNQVFCTPLLRKAQSGVTLADQAAYIVQKSV